MSYCRAKTRFVAEIQIEQFFERNRQKGVWFYTFTEPGRREGEAYWTKSQAERALKPFTDLLRRSRLSDGSKVEYLVFWEKQKRGSWHPHILLNKRFQVDRVRAWMVKRGWGPQMKFKFVTLKEEHPRDDHPYYLHPSRLRRYLIKYLTKAQSPEPKKKFFGGNCRTSNVNFRWVPWYKPDSFLFFYGRQFLEEQRGEAMTRREVFENMSYIVRIGVEATDWLSVDPWWVPSG